MILMPYVSVEGGGGKISVCGLRGGGQNFSAPAPRGGKISVHKNPRIPPPPW